MLPLVAGAWLLGVARGEEPPKGSLDRPVLSLTDGGVVPGILVDSGGAGMFRWQAEAFTSPFEFPRDEVLSIRFPAVEKSPKAVGALGFELSGGDVLFGSVVALDDKAAELDVARLGRLRVDRSRIRRIFRWRDGSNLLHDGPNGLVGWREVAPIKPRVDQPARLMGGVGIMINGNLNGPAPVKPKPVPPGPGWVEDGRLLRAVKDGATIQADVGLPPRASIELELAWNQGPDFLLALGVSDDEKTVEHAFRLEVWDGRLVLVRETDKDADPVPIQPVDPGPGRVRLQMFLDQELGKLAVYSEAGEPLAELKLGGGLGSSLPGVRLSNIRGQTTLERLRISPWDGEAPRPVGLDESLVRLTDHSIVRGRVERFEPTAHEFVVRGESGESRISEDRVDTIAFPRPVDETPRAVRVSYQDGTQLGGELAGVEGGKVILTVPGFAGPVQLPQQGLRSLDVPKRDARTRERDDRVGELQVDGLRILGHLADSGGRPGEGALVWQPRAGGTPSIIRPGASGRIVYRQTPTPRPADPPIPAPRGLVGIPGARSFVNQPPQPPERLMPTVRRSLYLRTGDIIPVEVTKIDQAGVWFRTRFSENGFVPNDRVKAVELAAEDSTSIRVNKAKFERLLTLPRMQRDSPPKHLIRSTNGDILRGTVIGMDDKTIGIEVRLEEKVVPRDRISRIIWLHADETDPSKKAAEKPAEAGQGMRVQAVRSDGIRLTFQAERFAGGLLSGKSEALGDCMVRVQDLDQLLIGGSVEKEAVQLAYQNFKLQLATEPKAALAERGELPEGGAAGTESAMVGKPAPDFQLDLLGGKKFHLAENKGKVIVLDFWATWCGPCLQAMPQIDRVTREFADKGVQLIAVNLQETPAQISAMLERQKLSPTVALDRDGVVAAKYGANAIPQTVVIDREGKVTRLFIGGGPHLGDQLREALQALMPAGEK